MKSIPKKNYLILFLILVFTVLLVFYARGWYNTSKEYYAKNSAIKDVTREINENELYSISVENPKFILYTSSGVDGGVKPFESKLKSLIIKNDMSDDILYLNLDNVDRYSFISNLKGRFASKKINDSFSTSSMSTFYIFQDGKIKLVLNDMNNYSTKYLDSLFKKWGFNDD